MKWLTTVFLAGTLLLSSCFGLTKPKIKPPENVDAYVPVYVSGELSISGEEPRKTADPGKIYATERYIFQNDKQTGVHVIDRNTTPPKKIAFLRIPFSTELAVRDNILYTNYVSDLIAINISDPLKPVLLNHVKNVFPLIQDYPPFRGYFVCPDKSKGTVAYWKLEKVEKVNCQR